MDMRRVCIVIGAGLLIGAPTGVLARGGSGSGSGLSPYAAESGNDRSSGFNNGNYRAPALDPYIQTYGGRYDPPVEYRRRPRGRGYYGAPY